MTEEEVVRDQGLIVVGVSAQIDKDSAQEAIGALWRRAAEAGLLKEGRPSYAVYYDYQDRLANRYRVLVGQASEAEGAPSSAATGDPGAAHEAVSLPPGRYHRATTRGEVVESVVRLWKSVWARREPLQRSFTVDFEQHEKGAVGSEVSLFVALASD